MKTLSALGFDQEQHSIKNSMDEMGLNLSALQAEVAKVSLESDATVSTQVSTLLAKVRQLSDDLMTKVLPEAKGAKSIAHSTRQGLVNAGYIAVEKKSKPFGDTAAAAAEGSPTTRKGQGVNPNSNTNSTLHQQFKAPARTDGLPRSVHSRLGASDRDSRDSRDSRDTDQSSENKENEGGPGGGGTVATPTGGARARGRPGPHAMSDEESEPIHITDSPPRTTSGSPPRKVLISDTNSLQIVTTNPPTYYDALTTAEFGTYPNVSHETVITTTRAAPAQAMPAAGRGQPHSSRPVPQASLGVGHNAATVESLQRLQRNQRLIQPPSPNFRPSFKNINNANRRHQQYQHQLQLQHHQLQQQQQQLQQQQQQQPQQQQQAQAQANFQSQFNQLQAIQQQPQNVQHTQPIQHRADNIIQQQQPTPELQAQAQALLQALNQGQQGLNLQAFLNQGQGLGAQGQGQGRGGQVQGAQGQGQGQGQPAVQGNQGHTGGQGHGGAQGHAASQGGLQ